MALRAVPDHPKFADLMAALNLPKFATLGILEAIWHFTGRYAPQGNVGKYTDQAIETWVGWNDRGGAMIEALVRCRWIDRDPVHRLLVHDWAQHADKATKNALARANLPFCTPTIPTPSVQCTNEKLGSSTPSRLPVPEPVPEPEPEPGPEFPANGSDKEESSDRERVSAKDKPSRGKVPPRSKSSKPPNPKHTPFRQAFEDWFRHVNHTEAPWDEQEAYHLSRFLKKNPTIEMDQWLAILANREHSLRITHAASLSQWICKALCWLHTLADDWGRPITAANDPRKPSATQQKFSELNYPKAGRVQ